jgi:hypothetical protein
MHIGALLCPVGDCRCQAIHSRVDVEEELLVHIEHVRVHASERELAVRHPAFELGEHRLRVGTGKRPRLRDRARLRELAQRLWGYQRAVDGKNETDVMRSSAKAGDQSEDGSALVGTVVEGWEREIEPVGFLSDCQDLVTDLTQQTPSSFRQRLAADAGERLRGAEALRCAADEENPRRWGQTRGV